MIDVVSARERTKSHSTPRAEGPQAQRLRARSAGSGWDADLELIRETLAGDAPATDRFVTRLCCVRRILAAQNQRTGVGLSGQELDDLAQDTILLVWKKRGQFTGESSIETWIYGIACFEWNNAVRSKRRQPLSAGLDASDLSDRLDRRDASPALPDSFEHEHLEQGLGRLDPLQARVLRLKHFEGRTFDEIAGILSLSASTAKTLNYRGLRRLLAELQDMEKGSRT